jgi:threonine dehydrogenase-like Zn-dependent dehydrogenase/predicted dehydrogenase
MKQVVQKLKDGVVKVVDVPTPSCGNKEVLIAVAYSLISAGTELSTMTAAQSSLVGKARARPDQVRQVMKSVKDNGLEFTLRAVNKRLDSYSDMGYSCSGIVIAVGVGVKGIKVGDFVAAAGLGYAVHAEQVTVPMNLVVKVPDSKYLDEAAFNSVASIALQSIRLSNPELGAKCVIIGFGLIGQILLKLLSSSCTEIIVVETDARRIADAKSKGIENIFNPVTESKALVDKVAAISGENGVDYSFLTASTYSNDPINLAGILTRKKGSVVIVGAVGTNFDRDPHYYRKELNLVISCSYGPGRYDPSFEEGCVDYPYPYVRWTEQRNMQCIQDLIASRKLKLDDLISHRFDVHDASNAYKLLVDKTDMYSGILLRYDFKTNLKQHKVFTNSYAVPVKAGSLSVNFIGPGNYAQSQILPNIAALNGVILDTVVSKKGLSGVTVQDKFKFKSVSTDAIAAISDPNTDAVFISSRHSSHFEYVNLGLNNNKHVYVEKPLCLNKNELDELVKSYNAGFSKTLSVGFNRSYSPYFNEAKKSLGDCKKSILYRINAGKLDFGAWENDLAIGGGRIVGEVCHFVEFVTNLSGSQVIEVSGKAFDLDSGNQDFHISMLYADGSVATILYLASGSAGVEKEYIEVHEGDTSIKIYDFARMEIFTGEKFKKFKTRRKDKGQKFFFAAMISGMKSSAVTQSPGMLFHVTDVTFAIVESLKSGLPVNVVPYEES